MNQSSRRLTTGIAALAAACALAVAADRAVEAATCTTGGAVGTGNANGYNAGYYDGLCGQYVWYGYGYNYNNYCANAGAYAHAAGIGTAGTGTCAAGTVYNYYAGNYHSQCRYWEYYGRGYNLNGYCSAANQYASAGQCTACQ